MFLHYNNGEEEKIIKNILCIDIIDGNNPANYTYGQFVQKVNDGAIKLGEHYDKQR